MARKSYSLHISLSLFVFFFSLLLLTSPAAAKLEEHITRTESGFYYTVQKGDTLWDLSKQFSDSPWEWPGLWSKNPQISNPHLIYPGQKLLIFKKDWEGMEKRPSEPLEPVKLSIIEPQVQPTSVKEDIYVFLGIDKVGFIRKEEITPIGVISKTRFNDKIVSSPEDYVYILGMSDSKPISVGDKCFSCRVYGPIKEADNGQMIGYQYLISGIVEIIEIKSDYCLAKIDKAFRPIEINDSLIPYEPRSTEIPIKDGIAGLSAKIIRAEEGALGVLGKNLTGDHEIVFFDKGKNDGIEQGQTYPIYQQEEKLFESQSTKYVEFDPVYIGKLMVLHTEATTSSAIILNSLRAIEPGQLVGFIQP